jgi:hypothetical protein
MARVRLRLGLASAASVDGQPGDHVAEDQPASEQDLRSLARRDRGLQLRRDAPAGLSLLPASPALWPSRQAPAGLAVHDGRPAKAQLDRAEQHPP